jgi:predicted small lipoprotein YifL
MHAALQAERGCGRKGPFDAACESVVDRDQVMQDTRDDDRLPGFADAHRHWA